MPSCVIFDGAITRTFLDHAHSNASVLAGGSQTFSGLNFGTANAGRVLVAVCETNSANALSSVTIGGVTATELVSVTGSGSGIYIATVPTGTSGNVVIAVSSNISRSAVQLYMVSGLSSNAASSTATSSANSPTATLNVPGGGLVIAGIVQVAGNSTSATWSGATEDADDSDVLTCYSSASIEVPNGNASLTVTGTFDSTTSTPRGVFAVFGP